MGTKNFEVLHTIILLLMQIIVNHYFNLGPYIIFAFLPLVLILLPIRLGNISTMVVAFLIGLLIDLIGNSILGLNAAALTATSGARAILNYVFITNDEAPKKSLSNIDILGSRNYYISIIIYYLVFLVTYNFLQTMNMGGILYNLSRIIISSGINILFAVLALIPLQFKRK